MSLDNLLDHKCDIYHLKKSKSTVGYGLSDTVSFDYGDIPDLKNVICHFGVESLDSSVEQKNPQNILTENTAERPRNIRGHHIFVYIKRTKEQEALK